MDIVEDVVLDIPLSFAFPDPGPLGIPIIQVRDVTFGYSSDKILFNNVNFSIDLESRIGLLGANGK